MKVDISNYSLEELYALRVEVNNLIEKHEKTAKESIALGIPVPNFSEKAGRMSRKWNDEAALVQALRDAGFKSSEIYDAKLKGIPAITKMVKDADVDVTPFIDITYAKPTLVYTPPTKGTTE